MRILIPIGSRAEMGLSAPIIAKLGEIPEIQVAVVKLVPGDFETSYKITRQMIELSKPDRALIVADRIEMTGAACACFHERVPFAHYFAGILNFPLSTLDDINRHCISLWSDIQFTESFECSENVRGLLRAVNKTPNIYTVGITHLEDLSLDDSLVPDHEYYLILYNPITGGSKKQNEELILIELKKIFTITSGYPTVVIYPNKDPGTEIINNALKDINDLEYMTIYTSDIPRPQFHALLKNCQKFISNSSATTYEAPYFLENEQIVKIGVRNMNRTPLNKEVFTMNASDEIVEVLKNWKMK